MLCSATPRGEAQGRRDAHALFSAGSTGPYYHFYFKPWRRSTWLGSGGTLSGAQFFSSVMTKNSPGSVARTSAGATAWEPNWMLAGSNRKLWRTLEPHACRSHSEIQRRYVEAGADCLIPILLAAAASLKRHLRRRLRAINQAGARIAREAFGDRLPVLGDPSARRPEPHGDLPAADAQAGTRTGQRPGRSRRRRRHHRNPNVARRTGRGHRRREAAKAPCIIASLAYDLSADKHFT